MAKVIFSIQYEINSSKKEEYFSVIKELKNLLKAEGLESYLVYELKGKPNNYQEIYTFSSNEAFDKFDDDQDERLNLLITKLSDLTTANSTKYTTWHEVTEI